MSDSEEETFCFYGKPLDPYDEDAFPKKKPISIEEQIATDAQGRRRFHGAFTGGFSAGFFNTVGSLEGWTPAEFKSSRQEKAQGTIQKPEDYMDEEDRGEFGIAPETIRTTSDYSKKSKRKRAVFADGPIPGEPVLHTLIESGNETIGYLLLKNIGLKHGGDEGESAGNQRVYGCEMPTKYEISRSVPVCEIPKIYEEYLKTPKENSFGMGYSGLDKSHINLFQSSGVVVREKNKKGFSIKGQAFGVGAFEEDDDDIYAKEDLSNYDFELTSEKVKKKSTPINPNNSVFDYFVLSKVPLVNKANFPLPTIPKTFIGKHKVKGSRWDQKKEQEPVEVERKDMNTLIRSKYLGEEVDTDVNFTSSKTNLPGNSRGANSRNMETLEDRDDVKKSSGQGFMDLLADKFVSATKPDDHSDLLAPVEKSETIHGTKEMREAARMKMFGPLTRTCLTWQPCSLLCKRFNVPEPKYDDGPKKEKRRTTHLIFEYQKQTDDESLYKPGLTVKKEPDDAVTEEPVEENTIETETPIESNTIPEPIINQIPEEKTQIIDITDKLDVSKNIDLFKAVFMSSSESEESDKEEEREEEKEMEIRREEIMKANVLGEALIPKIKPMKEGILSNVDFSKFSQSQPEPEAQRDGNSSNQEAEKQVQIREVEDNKYGPKLPTQILTKNFNLSKEKPSSEDEWVEKDEVDRKKSHKHKKKHRKEKHKKKKQKKERR